MKLILLLLSLVYSEFVFPFGNTRTQEIDVIKASKSNEVTVDDTLKVNEGVDVVNDVKVFSGTNKQIDVGEEIFEVISTGIYSPVTLSIDGSTTEFSVSSFNGHIVNSLSDTYTTVYFAGVNAVSPIVTDGIIYLLVDASGTLIQQTAIPSPQDRREKIYLGNVEVIASIVISTEEEPVVVEHVASSIYDLAKSLRIFNVSGNIISPNGANLNINKSSGEVFAIGSNYNVNSQDPHVRDVPSCTSCNFYYMTKNADSLSSASVIDPTSYDNAGVVTTIAGNPRQATIQRVYVFPSGELYVQYGPVVYTTLAEAVQSINTESFEVNPNMPSKSVLIALIVAQKNATDLTDKTKALVLKTSRFGQDAVGASGQSVSSLQDAYNNSVSGEIIIDSTNTGIDIKDASTPTGLDLFKILSFDELINFFSVSATEIKTSLPITVKELSVSPSTPASGNKTIFCKDDGKCYTKNSLGVESELGGGGGGSGGGENYNNAFTSLQNSDAEDGTTGWTASAGEFYGTDVDAWATSVSYSIGDKVQESGIIYRANTAHTSGVFASDIANWDIVTYADALEGQISFVWKSSAQNDYLDSPSLDVDKDIFLSNSCQASFTYIGGDENLTMQVIDADGDVKGEKVLPVHTVSTYENVFFFCPAKTATTNDKTLRFRLKNTGATASAVIKFDKVYVGTLIGLSESYLPNSFSATIQANGTVDSENTDWLNGNCSNPSPGVYNCNVKADVFSVAPTCIVSTSQQGTGFCATASNPANNPTATLIRPYCTTTGAPTSLPFNMTCFKQGADAEKLVQIYKSIPKVSDFKNVLSANFDSVGTRLSGDSEISCTNPATGRYNCSWSSLGLTSSPSISLLSNGLGGFTSVNCSETSSTLNSIEFECAHNTSGGATQIGFRLILTKNNGDYKTPVVQPILVNQVQTSVVAGVKEESCAISNNGSTAATDSDLCNNWITSVSRTGTGQVTVNINPAIFSKKSSCVLSPSAVGATIITSTQATKDVVLTYTRNASGTTSYEDSPFTIACKGER